MKCIRKKPYFFGILLKVFGIVIGFFVFIYILEQLNLITVNEQKTSKYKPYLYMAALYIYFTIVQGFSLFIFGTYHGIFNASMLMILFIIIQLRLFKKWKQRNTLLQLPLILLLIIYFVFIVQL